MSDISVFEQSFRLFVAPMPIKGLGVFTRELIPRDAVVDRCPGQRLSPAAIHYIWRFKAEHLHWFVDDHERYMYVVYGYGMLYNHDPQPNLTCDIAYDDQGLARAFTWTALRDILPGEELTFDYDLTLPFEALPNVDTEAEATRLHQGIAWLEAEQARLAERLRVMRQRLPAAESRARP